MIICNKTEILNDIPGVSIPQKTVMRRIGYPGNIKKPGKQIENIFNELIKESSYLINPAGSYIILKIKKHNENITIFDNSDFVIESPKVSKLLNDSVYAVVFIVTIGIGIETKVNDLSIDNQLTKAFILDAIGSETADAVADEIHYNLIKPMAETEGYTVTPRFSPGYGDWDIKVQSKIVDICKGTSLGIKVNKYSMMIPQKSISAVFGLKKIILKQ